MAYNNKYKSVLSILEDAYRDSGLDDIDYETAIADTVELIDLMGVPYNYVERNTNGIDQPVVQVVNYRAALPYDLQSLVSMRKVTIDSDYKVIRSEEMVETTDLYHQTQVRTETDINFVSPTSPTITAEVDADTGEVTVEDAVVVGPAAKIIKDEAYAYKIKNGIIFTNFKDGYLDINYRAYILDDHGMIMIPADGKLSTALKYHIIYKNDYRKWRAFPEKPGLKALLNDSETNRDYYVAAARNKAHIPTVDKMESIKNMWVRSNNDFNAHRNGFKTLHNQQRRKY